ncbi:MAG: tetratricopeptide repeat protein [Fibrella sp.]|nr:tetratricopeptide repeat protein [Armatimonadota bacterium]
MTSGDIYLSISLVGATIGAGWWLTRKQSKHSKRPVTGTSLSYRECLLQEAWTRVDQVHPQKRGVERGERIYNMRLAAESFAQAGDRFNAAKCRSFLAEDEGDFMTAAAHIEMMLRLLPDSEPASARGALLVSKANNLRRCGWYRSATETSIQAVQSDAIRQSGVVALHLSAQLLATMGRFEDAEAYATLALESSKNGVDSNESQTTLAFLRHVEGRLMEALNIYEVAAKESRMPNDFSSCAQMLMAMGRWQEAEERQNEALRYNGANPPLIEEAMCATYRVGLAFIYRGQERYEEALKELDMAEPVLVNDVRLSLTCRIQRLTIMAESKAEPTPFIREQWDAIVADLDKEIQNIPRHWDALRFWYDEWHALAAIRCLLGDVDVAMGLLEPFARAKILHPVEMPRYYFLRGLCREKQQDFSGAMAEYRHVLSSDCEPVERHFGMARARLMELSGECVSAVQ